MSNHLISPLQYYNEVYNQAEHLLIDIRNENEYNLNHIPQALLVSRQEYQNNPKHLSLVCDHQTIQDLLNKINYQPHLKIYLYDDRNSYDSCYLWWVLLYYGISNVYVIDGGIKLWTSLNLALTNEKTKLIPTNNNYDLKVNPHLIARLEDLKNEDFDVLIDTRTKAEYQGEVLQAGALQTGHIKGAQLIDFIDAIDLNQQGQFKSLDLLQEIYQPYLNGLIIVYCQAGVRSALTFFVLYDLLNYHQVKNYAGSWMEYSHYV
ncbi:MAG: sulfurtransferase [Bacilli bacterium]